MSADREQGKKPPGFKIDSTLIHAATTSDLQGELSGLGVSVYDQQEFEEGVLNQIDKEFSKRAAEQQNKFLLKEHSNVKKDITTLQDEIKGLSKTICTLLSRPLCDVVTKLREVKASQEQKNKQLLKLLAREKELSEKIASQPSGAEGEATPPSATPPASVPSTEGSSFLSRERLIQLGHLTPFGTDIELPVDMQGPAGSLGGEGRRTEGSLGNATQEVQASKLQALGNEEQLLSSSFGSGSSGPGSDIMRQEIQAEEEEVTSLQSEEEEYVPNLQELESSHSDGSEHFTEDELSHSSDKKGKKRLREVHSDESEDELVETNWPKKRPSCSTRKKKTQDDGDEELYQLRISKHAELKSDPAEPDVVFSGGFSVPGSIWHKLYKYQQTGVRWLWELHGQQAGGIVGDEMGLGKTIQMIAFLAGLNVSGLRSNVTGKLGLGPVLILCPATVMHQWVCEFHKWWPPFRVAVLHGTGTFSGQRQRLVNRIVKCNGILLTTYAGVRIYKEHLMRHKWDYLVLDEGHKIRNPDADVTIVCKQFATPHRIILSGSPMQNNLRELWSLFDFVFPGKLGTLPVFMEQFSVPITLGGYANATEVQVRAAYKCACVLRDSINPYLLRRLKADVKIQLPDKNEQVLFCRLTEYQRELYQDFIHSPQVQAMLAGGRQVFSGLVTLRKLCNHPDLVTGDYSPTAAAEKADNDDDCEDFITIDVPKERKEQLEEEGYGHWGRAGKMIVVESLLKLWKSQNHRVLLFTQGRQMLDILEQFVSSRGYTYQRMDGCSSIASRQPMVNKFNEDDSIFVFLLTTRVGGLGINLTGADRVLIYDPDWNPSTDTQARERAWRIGQTRPVTIYRLLCSGTIEEKIYHRQIFKQFLTNRVLKDPRQRRFFKSNDLHELFTLSSTDSLTTDTGAIFAGTHSEQIPRKSVKQKQHGMERGQHGMEQPLKEKDKSAIRHKDLTSYSDDLVHSNIPLQPSEHTNTPLQPAGTLDAPNTSQNISCLTGVREELWMSGGLPGTSGGLPGTSGGLPGTSGGLPGTSGGLPGTSGGLPGISGGLLGTSGGLPGTSGGLISTSEDTRGQTRRPIAGPHSSETTSQLCPGTSQQGGIRRRKSKHKHGSVDGVKIAGVERTKVFEYADQESSQKQDDFVLRKLFKRTGVQSAMLHDAIMDSADADYVLIEAEAKAVAKSASQVLKESRRQCLRAPLGWPTWTGQHGIAGAPKQRFGSHVAIQSNPFSNQHFDGELSQPRGSLNTASGDILAKIRSRNVHTLPAGSASINDSQRQLLTDIRNFIATQCKVGGQATTNEILTKFQGRLPTSDTAVFRSMLHEICDFSRHHGGEGLWQLKPEFR